uniref:Uncharacterized protein n=1 Tax=Fagus sylvatica TaxID=28930 RepID=A0A2N9FC22_FAGSY
MPVTFIGKEDHPIDWYGAPSGDGVLKPPANRTAPIQVLHPQASASQVATRHPLSLWVSVSLIPHPTFRSSTLVNRFGNFFAPLGLQQAGSQEHPTKQVNSQQYLTL